MKKPEVGQKPGAVRTYFWQLYALLYKNAVLFKRNYVSSAVQLLAPAVCVLLFGLVVYLNGIVTVDRDPAALMTLGGSDGISLKDRCVVFDNAGGRFGFGKPMKNVECVTLVYAPQNAVTNELMASIAKDHGDLEMGKDILGFADMDSMASYFGSATAKPVFAGILFNETLVSETVYNATILTGLAEGGPAASLLMYEVWYNKTVADFNFLGQAGLDPVSFETAGGMSSYVLQVQHAVNQAILKMHSGKDDATLEVKLKPFPVVPGENVSQGGLDSFLRIEAFGSLFYIVGIMISFIITLRQIVQEKDDKILDALRMMGLYESCYWLSWVVYYAILLLPTALLMVLAGRLVNIPMFLYTDFGWLFLVLYFYLFAMAAFAMGISALLPNTKLAVMIGFLFLTVAVITQLMVSVQILPVVNQFYDPFNLAVAARNAINLYPPLLYAKIDQNMYLLTQTVQKQVNGSVVEEHGYYTWDDARDGAYQYLSLAGIPFSDFNNVKDQYDFEKLCLAPGSGGGPCYDHTTTCYGTDYVCDDISCYSPQCRVEVCSSDWKSYVSEAECLGVEGGIFYSSGTSSSCRCSFSLPPDSESLGRMIASCLFWVFFAWYFGQVITFGHGRAEPLWFPFTPWYWLGSFGVKNPFAGSGKQPTSDGNKDDDVQQEEQAIRSGEKSDEDQYPVVIQNLVKDFGGLFSKRFRAVNGITLALEKGNCFALLGHNGAGKTTAINMLSGMIAPSGGDSMIYGKSVRDSISSIRHEIGVCPQHDILWAQLTAREHLRFYGHFQGMNLRQVREQGEYLLKQVHLDGLKRVAGNYSGGMRRRLSMTIAALGNKRIIFLDEPTTGLDPQNQRHVWDMINELKEGRVVILTTHLMDEADMLGDRIGIMSRGRLVALGNPLHLKAKFGGNYKISINPMDGDASRQAIDKEVRRLVPNVNLDESSGVGSGPMVYSIPPSSFNAAPDLFRWIDADGSSLVKDWGLSQTSLEDVFVSLDDEEKKSKKVPFASVINEQNGVSMDLKAVDQEGQPDTGAVEEFQSEYTYDRTFRGQVRGLFLKSTTLQLRQRKTVFCQILIPLALIGLLAYLTSLISTEVNTYDEDFASCFNCLSSQVRAIQERDISSPGASYCSWDDCVIKDIQAGEPTPQELVDFANAMGPYFTDSTYYYTLEELKQAAGSAFNPDWFSKSKNPLFQVCTQSSESYRSCKAYDAGQSSELLLVEATYMSPFLESDRSYGNDNEVDLLPNILVGFEDKSAALASAVGSACFDRNPSLVYSQADCFVRDSSVLGVPIDGNSGDVCYPSPETDLFGNITQFYLGESAKATGLLSNVPWRVRSYRLTSSRFNSGGFNSASSFALSPSMCSVETFQGTSKLSPDLQQASNQSTLVNELLLKGQEDYKSKNGDFSARVPLSNTLTNGVLNVMNDYFPTAALLFSEVSPADGKLRYTHQGYIAERASWCIDSGYSFVAVDVDGPETSSSCNQNAIGVSPERSNQDSTKVYTTNRILNGLTSAMLRSHTNPSSPFSPSDDVLVILGSRPLPFNPDSAIDSGNISELVSGFMAAMLVPLATTFLLPVLVFHLVHEKEHKLRSSLLMMGMQMKVYWLVQFLFDLAISVIVLIAVYILGAALGISVFTNHEFGFVIITLLLWALTQIGLAFFFSVLFSKTRNANIAMYLLVLSSAIAGFILNSVVFAQTPYLPAPAWYMWFPPFTYCRGIYLLTGRSYYWEDVDGSDELVKVWGILILQSIVLFLSTFYLDIVLPKEFGIRRGPFFFIEDLVALCRKKDDRVVGPEKVALEDEDDEDIEEPAALVAGGVDPDVAAEQQYVLQGNADNAPIRIINLKKRFGNFQAVDGVTMHMKDKSLTSLLGPNGAGKSTTISMLTGLYGPSSGEAFVDQKSIVSQMQLVHNVIGVCPQHDITWPELTIKEHLLLYARLKGIPRSKEVDLVKNAIAAVKLTGHELKRARQLSGGQRRRLSIAISFIGNPRVVFLDEPTTGVDPVTRSQVHDLVLREKNKRCIVLTTHLMSESEKLSDRIAIMAHGKLKTIGTANRLKQKYNEGFKLILVVSDAARAEKFVTSRLPGAVLESKVNAKVTYQIDAASDLRLADVWELMQEGIKDNGISDWQISATTLEDVFIQIASESEATYGTA